MIPIFWSIDIGLAIASVLAMIWVLAFYVRQLKVNRSRLTVLLTVFSAAFVAQNLASSVLYYKLSLEYTSTVAIPLLVITVFGFIGLFALFLLTRQ